MKKLFTIVLLVSGIARITSAQTPNWIWAVHSSGGNYQYPNGIWVDKYDSLFLAGRLAGTISFGNGVSATGGNDNPFVAKLDSSGNSKWIKEITYGSFDYPWGFCIDNKSNVYSAGVVSSGQSMFIEKYDSHGNLKWSITPSGGGIAGMGLITDGADNLYVTGAIQGNVTLGSTTLTYTGLGQNVYLAKLDTNGHFLWAVNSGVAGGNSGYDVARSITIDQFANVYIAGGYGGTPTFGSLTAPAAAGGTSSLFIAEYDSSGHALNLITAPNAGINNGDCCTLNHITLDSCRNIYITGYYENTTQFGNFSLTSHGQEDIYVARASNSGVWQWANSIGGSGNDNPGGITFDKNSDIYVGGQFSNGSAMFGSTPVSGGYYFVAKYANSNGALQWVQTAGSQANGGNIGGIAVDGQKHVYVTGDGGNGTISFGSKSVSATSNADIFVAKLDTVPARTILPVINSSYCPGSTNILPYTINGTFNNGNTFTAELSDSTGSFASPVTLGDTTLTTGGSINITIPPGTPSGSNYLIRVVSSNPATSSYVNGCGAYYASNVYVNDFPVTIGGGSITAKVSNDTSICSGSFVQLHASGGSTYSWSPGATLNDSTSANPFAAPTSPQIYTVIVSSGSCGTDTAKVTVNVSPVLNISVSPDSTTACSGSSVSLTATGASSYNWTPSTGLSCTACATPTVTPQASTTYTVTGNNGVCSNSILVKVNVGNTAIGGTIAFARDTICQNTPGNLTLTQNSGSSIQWQSSIDSINFTDLTGDTLSKLKTTPLQQTTWYRAITGTGNCSAVSDTQELYVPPALVASFYITQTSNSQFTFNSDSSRGSIRSYHWDFGDGQTSTDSNPSHTYNKDTTYYVCLTLYDGSNCSYTFCRYNAPEGVPVISANGNWFIYPNPFGDQLTISSKHGNSYMQRIDMYDMLGRLVINNNTGNSTSTSLQLDVSALAKGMYYVMIRTADADYVQKVVKQ